MTIIYALLLTIGAVFFNGELSPNSIEQIEENINHVDDREDPIRPPLDWRDRVEG